MKQLRKLLSLFVRKRNQYNNVSSKSKKSKTCFRNFIKELRHPEYNENIPDLE